MAVKIYEVLENQSYTGKRKTYSAGECFTESELFGNKDNIKIAIEGQRHSENRPEKKPKIRLKK